MFYSRLTRYASFPAFRHLHTVDSQLASEVQSSMMRALAGAERGGVCLILPTLAPVLVGSITVEQKTADKHFQTVQASMSCQPRCPQGALNRASREIIMN